MTLYVDANGRRYAVDVTHRNGAFLVSVAGRQREVDVKATGGVLSLLVGTKSYEVSVDGSAVHVGGIPVDVVIVSPRPSWGRAATADSGTGGPRRVTAPMPGKIVKLLVKPGDRVEPRQGLVQQGNPSAARRPFRRSQFACARSLAKKGGKLQLALLQHVNAERSALL